MAQNRTVLYVSGFSSGLRAKDLAYEFERYGRLMRCDIPALKTPSSTPFAFIEFRREDDAEDAYYDMHGRTIDGRRIAVQWAKRPPSAQWRNDGFSRPRDDRRDRRDDRDRDRDYRRDRDDPLPPPSSSRRRSISPPPRRGDENGHRESYRSDRDRDRDSRDRRGGDYDDRNDRGDKAERNGHGDRDRESREDRGDTGDRGGGRGRDDDDRVREAGTRDRDLDRDEGDVRMVDNVDDEDDKRSLSPVEREVVGKHRDSDD